MVRMAIRMDILPKGQEYYYVHKINFRAYSKKDRRIYITKKKQCNKKKNDEEQIKKNQQEEKGKEGAILGQKNN